MFKHKPLKGIFFDFDGTLANSIGVMAKAYEMFLVECKRRPTQNEFEKLNGPPLSIVVKELKSTHGLPHEDSALLKRYNEIIDELYTNVQLNDGASELIEAATKSACLLGIVTSNSKQRVNNWLASLNLMNKFDFIVSGEDVVVGKPSPEPYLLALEMAKLSADQVIAIEDSSQGANSALMANIETFFLSNKASKNLQARENLSYISSLNDLSDILFIKN